MSKFPQFWKVSVVLFFGGKGFAEVNPKGRRVLSIFLLPSNVFWCSPYSRKRVKLHTYIALLEVHGCLICRMLYITSPAGLLHPTLVWRFQEATNIPMQGGAWPVCPLMPWHYRYSFTPEWGEALSIWSKGVLNPSYLSFDSGQSRTCNLSHTSQELYHCATKADNLVWTR